jgi:hypothetical protein
MSNIILSTQEITELPRLKLNELAVICKKDWKNIPVHAKAYLEPMTELDNISQNFYQDSGKSIVLYFLANASQWTGPTARAVKAELKRRAGVK